MHPVLRPFLLLPLLAACGISVESERLVAGNFVPLAVLSDGSVAFCDRGDNTVRVLPGEDGATPEMLFQVESCNSRIRTVVRRNVLVVVPPKDALHPDPAPLAWSRTSSFLVNGPPFVRSSELAASWDDKWFFAREPGEEAGTAVLVAYDLTTPNPVGRVVGPVGSGGCASRLFVSPEPSTTLFSFECMDPVDGEDEEKGYVFALDWAKDFAKTTVGENLQSPIVAPASVTRDGKYFLTTSTEGALVRVPLAGGSPTTFGSKVRTYRANERGDEVVILDEDGKLLLWTEDDGVREVMKGVEVLAGVNADFEYAVVSTKSEEHTSGDGESSWTTYNLVQVELSSGKTVDLVAGTTVAPDSTELSDDGEFLVWIDDATELGTGTAKVVALGSGDASTTLAQGVGSVNFTDEGTILMDANHAGGSLWGNDARYDILALGPDYDGEPLVVAKQSVVGKLHSSGSESLFYVLENDGLYKATVK